MGKVVKKSKKVSLLTWIFISFVLAIFAGAIFGESIKIVQPVGDLFLRLVKFLIVPLILSTLVVGVASTGSVSKLGRLGGKTISYYLITTLIASVIGVGFGLLFSPGSGIEVTTKGEVPEPGETGGFINVLLNIVPINPIASLANGEILQTIFFALFIGIGITMVGEKANPVYRFFDGFAEVMYKITGIIMKFVPFGIFGVLAPIIGINGLAVLVPLLKLVLAVGVGCLFHALVVYCVAVKTLGKMSPIKFFKGIAPAMMVAFSTQSSSGTLPVTIKNSEENLGISKDVSSFVLPLGATINMDGQAIYITVAALFTAQFFGIDLSTADMFMIILFATIGSIGTAGVPGAGIIMLSTVFAAVNLPLEGIALIAGVDRFLNMFSTTINVTGDVTAAVYVNESEKKRERLEMVQTQTEIRSNYI